MIVPKGPDLDVHVGEVVPTLDPDRERQSPPGLEPAPANRHPPPLLVVGELLGREEDRLPVELLGPPAVRMVLAHDDVDLDLLAVGDHVRGADPGDELEDAVPDGLLPGPRRRRVENLRRLDVLEDVDALAVT